MFVLDRCAKTVSPSSIPGLLLYLTIYTAPDNGCFSVSAAQTHRKLRSHQQFRSTSQRFLVKRGFPCSLRCFWRRFPLLVSVRMLRDREEWSILLLDMRRVSSSVARDKTERLICPSSSDFVSNFETNHGE